MYDPRAHILLKRILSDLPDKTGDDDFRLRLSAGFHGIYNRFETLYGQRPDLEQYLEDLVKILYQKYTERSRELKQRDRQREKEHDWFLSHRITGMMLYVDRFSDDLKGFIPKIKYLKEIGINLVHMMPLLEGPPEKNDGGYAVSNYRKTDPRYGTHDDFLQVIAELHKNGMYLMTDLVINHTSDEHPWALKAKQGDLVHQEYYHTFKDRTVPDLFERSLPEIFPESCPGNFTFSEEMDQWVMTVFHDYQWDLNYTNPRVLLEMIDILLHQANWGIDIFRLDAVAFVWKQLGTQSQNLPHAHLILQLYKLSAQIVAPGVALLAEAIVAPGEIVRYFGTSSVWSNECDMAYNATLMALLWDAMATHNARVLNAGIRSMPSKPKGTTWINYIRCHDDIGLGYSDENILAAGYSPQEHRRFIVNFLTGRFKGSFAQGLTFMFNPKNGDARISGSLASLAGLESAVEDGDRKQIELATRRIILLHAIMLSYGGIPMLYYGDELATLNDYTFFEDADRVDDNRWVHRPLIDWKKTEDRKKKGLPEYIVFNAIRKMIRVRCASEEWADYNNTKVIDANNEYLFSFIRRGKQASTMVIANFKDEAQSIDARWVASYNFDVHRLRDKYTKSNIIFYEGTFELEPYRFLWLTEAAN